MLQETLSFRAGQGSIQQCIPLGRATYLRASVFPYQSIYKRLISSSSFRAPIPVRLEKV